MNIPTWEEVKTKKEHLEAGNPPVEKGGATFFCTFTELDPLEKFIYDNEPAMGKDKEWRKSLQEMIEYLAKGKNDAVYN